MKKNIYILFIGLLFLTVGCASNSSSKKSACYSYVIGDVYGDKIYTEHNADTYVNTASCQKTITALLAYKILGFDYCYETNLYFTRKDGLTDDLIISFSGDPTLKSSDLVNALMPLKGVKISGKVLLDLSLFKTQYYPESMLSNDFGKSFARPISSANIDRNFIVIRNKRHNEILDLDAYIIYKMQTILKKNNITADIQIIKDAATLPPNMILFGSVKSKELRQIIIPALKKSDNFVFDSIYLKIIHMHKLANCDIKTWSDGDKIIKDLIWRYFNINMLGAAFVDGSGLSRSNMIQPRKLFELLKQGYYIREFVNALPSPGERGSTLVHRIGLFSYIRAKTGNMTGISCLCGYSLNKNPKAFVIVADNFSKPNSSIIPIIDRFVNFYSGN